MSDVNRRTVMAGFGGMTLAAVLADPKRARAAAASLSEVGVTTPGGRRLNAALGRATRKPAPAVLLVHEWWGLNDQIKSVAADLAQQGYTALACDLYDGQLPRTAEEAGRIMQSVDAARATETLVTWLKWLKADAETGGKVATIGWCFGGGWALNAAIAEPVDGTVVYYGKVDQPVDRLRRLQGPMLGHFAEKDTWITRAMVEGFETAMRQAGKSLTVYWYQADHAFANPTGARYDAADAALAWQRTLAFFETTLR